MSEKRIRKRSRDEELNIDIDYLNDIHHLHDDWLLRQNQKDLKVLTIDANREFETDLEY